MKRCSNSIAIVRVPTKVAEYHFLLSALRPPSVNKDVHENTAFWRAIWQVLKY